ncbi:hypothetical protein PNOK_0122600 [Pyrrhoderma noxium]|uniref:Transmembrane protein n=1 Tax=Pyrrhoderma noxium TaxID=2282107 RepID=A0A286UX72_9AGAM|nr:hypothetical protein PNOK_0122600 [Pyrrhoderma noxium]
MVRSQKFFCCLPVRLGVFLLSFVECAWSGIIAALMYYILFSGRYSLPSNVHTAAIIIAVLSTLFSVISLLGFIGSLFRRKGLVKIFSTTLNWLFGITVIADIAGLVLLFITSKDKINSFCEDLANGNQDTLNNCEDLPSRRWYILGSVIINWIIQLYLCIIVAKYVVQLQEEKEEKWRLSSMKTYTQVAGRDSTDAFHPPTSYPYTEKAHSYGNV